MSDRIEIGDLSIHSALYSLIETEIAPGTGIEPQVFWKSLGEIVKDLTPLNMALLEKRDQLQAQIDQWHEDNKGASLPNNAYVEFLRSIDYLIPEGEDFQVESTQIDSEIASIVCLCSLFGIQRTRVFLNVLRS